MPSSILQTHALEHREMRRHDIHGLGVISADERRRNMYALGGATAVVGLWGLSFWWLTR